MLFEIILFKPALYSCSPFIGKNKSDGHINHFMQAAGKEITYSTALISCIWIDYFPMAFCIILRRCAHCSRDFCITYSLNVSCFGNCFLIAFYRAVIEAFQWHLHIALSSTNPYFTREDIMKCYRVPLAKSNTQGCITTFWSSHTKIPSSIFVGFHDLLIAP